MYVNYIYKYVIYMLVIFCVWYMCTFFHWSKNEMKCQNLLISIFNVLYVYCHYCEKYNYSNNRKCIFIDYACTLIIIHFRGFFCTSPFINMYFSHKTLFSFIILNRHTLFLMFTISCLWFYCKIMFEVLANWPANPSCTM